MRRARQLSLLSIGWMSVEAGVAIALALAVGSVALLGFGLDSLIELASAATILWLYTAGRGNSADAERRAQHAIAICFAALAVFLTVAAIDSLATVRHPDTSWPGVAVTLGAVIFMPLLARAKNHVAAQLDSAATAGDAAQSGLCALSAVAVLLSILTNQLFGSWWLDPVAALGIAGLAAYESRTTWRGDTCADCTPIGFSPHSSCNCC